MCRPPASESYCGGARHCAVLRATVQSAPLRAIKPWRAVIAFMHFRRGHGWSARDAILEVGIHAAEGELLACVVACLFEGVVCKSPIVAVIVVDFDAMFGSEGLEGAFGSDGFDRQVIDLGVHVS